MSTIATLYTIPDGLGAAARFGAINIHTYIHIYLYIVKFHDMILYYIIY